MQISFPIAVTIGIILGFLGGLGVGGGSLLMLWLTLALNMPHQEARLINLLFFIPCALISSLFRWKQGKPPFATVVPAVVAGCLSAGFFAWLSGRIDMDWLNKLFGVLLLFTGVKELLYKQKNKAG